MTAINAIADILNTGKSIAGLAGGIGNARGAIGKINSAAGAALNIAAGATSITNSIKSLFGGDGAAAPDPKVSSINKLRSHLSRTDILSNNLFYVEITAPGFTDAGVARTLPLLCYSAALPGISFASSEVRRFNMGITEKQPTFPIMTDLSLTFIGDGEGKVRYFFSNWMNSIVKYRKPASSSNPKHEMFEIGYKRDYTCTIDIVVVDRYNKKIFHTKVHEAWPIALGDQSLNWNDNDSLMNIPVTFTYYNWTQEVIDIDTASLAGDLAPSILGKVVKIGTAIQTLATIKKPKSIGDIINVTRNASNVVNGLKGLF